MTNLNKNQVDIIEEIVKDEFRPRQLVDNPVTVVSVFDPKAKKLRVFRYYTLLILNDVYAVLLSNEMVHIRNKLKNKKAIYFLSDDEKSKVVNERELNDVFNLPLEVFWSIFITTKLKEFLNEISKRI